jgi:hypothetical protein
MAYRRRVVKLAVLRVGKQACAFGRFGCYNPGGNKVVASYIDCRKHNGQFYRAP